MQMFDEIQKSAELYPYFDYAHGYGIPQASYFLKQENLPDTLDNELFKFDENNGIIYILIENEHINKADLSIKNYLYYHIENKNGVLEKYWLVEVYQKEAAEIPVEKYSGMILKAHYKGYTSEYEIKK